MTPDTQSPALICPAPNERLGFNEPAINFPGLPSNKVAVAQRYYAARDLLERIQGGHDSGHA